MMFYYFARGPAGLLSHALAICGAKWLGILCKSQLCDVVIEIRIAKEHYILPTF